MTHLLGQPFVHSLRGWAQGSGWASALVVVGLLIALVVTAWLVQTTVEKPARRRLQAPVVSRPWRRRRSRPIGSSGPW